MDIRQQVSKYSGTVTVVAIAGLVLAIGVIVRGFGAKPDAGAPDKTHYFFFDPESAELTQLPSPVSPATQNGRELFRAHVYSCSNCSDVASRFVGFIEKLSPERQASETRMRSGLLPGEELRPAARAELQQLGGQFISLPTPIQWVTPNSPDAATIQTALQAKCPGKPLACTPDAQ